MPFKKDDEQTKEWAKMGARKPYALEQEQLERMRKILNKDLEIIERIQESEEINPVDEKKLAIAKERVGKYLDKLHASRTSLEGVDDKPLVIQISESIAKKNDINTQPEPNSTGSTQI